MNQQAKQTIRASEIRRLYLADCSAVTFWRLRRADLSFPQAFKLGGTNYWDREEVRTWYNNTRKTHLQNNQFLNNIDFSNTHLQTNGGVQNA